MVSGLRLNIHHRAGRFQILIVFSIKCEPQRLGAGVLLRGVEQDLHALANRLISPTEKESSGPGFKTRVPNQGILDLLQSWQSHRGNTFVPHVACIGRLSCCEKLRNKRIEVLEMQVRMQQ